MCLYMHQALYQKKKAPKHFDMYRVVKFSRYHFTFHLFCKPTPLSPQTVTLFSIANPLVGCHGFHLPPTLCL